MPPQASPVDKRLPVLRNPLLRAGDGLVLGVVLGVGEGWAEEGGLLGEVQNHSSPGSYDAITGWPVPS